jgi:hypothetical protein
MRNFLKQVDWAEHELPANFIFMLTRIITFGFEAESGFGIMK